jgi:hypothetical protein
MDRVFISTILLVFQCCSDVWICSFIELLFSSYEADRRALFHLDLFIDLLLSGDEAEKRTLFRLDSSSLFGTSAIE